MRNALIRLRLGLFLAVLSIFALGAIQTTAFETGQKSVHVKEYKRKDGTTVKAHDRKAPKARNAPDATPAKGSSASSARATHARTRCENCDRDSRGRILRGRDAKKAFMRATGFPHGRSGFVIDHIMPLACGGADVPSNMQWQTITDAKAKDQTERANCR